MVTYLPQPFQTTVGISASVTGSCYIRFPLCHFLNPSPPSQVTGPFGSCYPHRSRRWSLLLSERFNTTTGSSAILLRFTDPWVSPCSGLPTLGRVRTSPGKTYSFHPNPAIPTCRVGARASPCKAKLPTLPANTGSLSFSSGFCLRLPSDSPLPVTPLPSANAYFAPRIRDFHPIVVCYARHTLPPAKLGSPAIPQ